MNMKLVPSQWDTDGIDVELANKDRVIIEWFDPNIHPADLKDGEAREVDGWTFHRRDRQVVVIAHAAAFRPARQSTGRAKARKVKAEAA